MAQLLCTSLLLSSPAEGQTLESLREMSIEDLAQINVSSVSKTDQPLGDAAAAVYVIRREDIIRSGAVTLPEMLRLAPNLQVYQISPAQWVVTARGLSGNPEAQNFANKLLVLVDGRTVYTPLFSGVYWDLPDVLPDNVDRIEVISGPGATLWGANAVNGVINVVTRSSSEVGGLYADLRAGPDRQAAGLRYGGTAGDSIAYQIHARGLREDEAFRPSGEDAENGWKRLRGGFRLDWTPSAADSVTLQGEVFDGRLDRAGTAFEEIGGRNLNLRWMRHLPDAGELQAQFFYDRIERASRPNGLEFHVDTYDADFQHSFALAERHQLVWGGGARIASYDIGGTPALYVEPASRDLFIANAFVQDSFAATPELTLTAGLKVEHLPYAGVSLHPEVRVAWKPSPTALIWGSVARAVRSPTPFDTEVEERTASFSLSGNPDFRTEKLTAAELGVRLQPLPAISFSTTLFYHRYDDLRTIERVSGPGEVALGWDNGLKGSTYGIEAWADWRVTRWWTLAGGATVLERDFRFQQGASSLFGTAQLGGDPPYTAVLRSSMNLRQDLFLDLNFRAVGALPEPSVPAYQELGGRLAWQATRQIALSLSGTNLLDDRHQEYPGGSLIPRRVLGGVELRF